MNSIIRGYDPNTKLPPTPSVVIVNKLAHVLNVPVDDLVLRFQGIDPAKINKKTNGNSYESFAMAVAQKLEALYPNDPKMREKKLSELLESDAFAALLASDSTVSRL